jgi:hypothetical protein
VTRRPRKDGHVSEFLIIEVVLRASRIHGAHLSVERVHDTRRLWVQDADVVGIGHLGSWVIAGSSRPGSAGG